jgi:hypothetical protein
MTLVEGPVWAEPGLTGLSVLNPLRVENPMFAVVERFLSGVISTTPHARYLGLHGLVRREAIDRGLDLAGGYDLMRRCEAVMAAIAHYHSLHRVELPAAHGEWKVAARLEPDGSIDVDRVSAKGAYTEAMSGFYGTYRGPEIVLGVVAAGATQEPGDRFDEPVVRAALGDLLDLATRARLSADELRAASHLCPCAADGDEAAWLRSILCGTAGGEAYAVADEARRDTARIVTRVVSAQPQPRVKDLQPTLRRAVAFGPPLDQGLLAGIDLAEGWRGLMLRNYSVGAWRNLWWWLVRELAEPQSTGQVTSALAAELPEGWTVADLTDHLPAGVDGDTLLPAEDDLRAEHRRPDPLTELRLLAAGARRLDELTGRAQKVMAGEALDDLGPVWVADELASSADRPLRAWAAELGERLLWRSHRIALTKLDLANPAKPRLPAQVAERDGRWHKVADAGWGEVGLRLPSFTSMLAGAGVLGCDEGGWWLTEEGTSFVG